MIANPGSGGRTARRWRRRPDDASSVRAPHRAESARRGPRRSRIPRAFSRGQATRAGLTSTGLRHHQHNRSPV